MSSVRPFNTSTKDSRSIKLRNPHLSSKESERLDTDNYKMEARLRELKLSMKRQKQERENMHSDGSIWSSGKPGAITTHGTDLLKKEPSKPTQSKGKDEHVDEDSDSELILEDNSSTADQLQSPNPDMIQPAIHNEDDAGLDGDLGLGSHQIKGLSLKPMPTDV